MDLPDASPSSKRSRSVLRVPNPMEASRADWQQLIRFCVVGISGVAVNMAVFTLLIHQWDIHHIVAATVSFAVAWTSNFLLNKHWTFRSHDRSIVLQGARNLTVSLVALGFGLVILELLQREMSKVLAQLIAIAVVTPVTFLLNRRWSFR